MNKASREKRSPHPRKRYQVKKLELGQACEVSAYLVTKDVRPAPNEWDLAAFVGRADVGAFVLYEQDRVAGVVAGVLDWATVRLAWLAVDKAQIELAWSLVEQLERFAQQSQASMIFAQAVEDSDLHRLLAGCGFTQNSAEAEVVAGRHVQLVDLVKLLGDGR